MWRHERRSWSSISSSVDSPRASAAPGRPGDAGPGSADSQTVHSRLGHVPIGPTAGGYWLRRPSSTGTYGS